MRKSLLWPSRAAPAVSWSALSALRIPSAAAETATMTSRTLTIRNPTTAFSISATTNRGWECTPALSGSSFSSSSALVFSRYHQHTHGCRYPRGSFFSNVAPSPAPSEDLAAAAAPTPVVFKYPKAQAMFERILQICRSQDDIRALNNRVNANLGRTIHKYEFYYKTFGGKVVPGSRFGRRSGTEAVPADLGGEEGATAANAAPAPAAKTTVDLKLISFDEKAKIKVIKEVRALVAGLGLKEAKELVESAPKVLQTGLTPEAAAALKTSLEAAGAVVELV